jgi:hypothetical protein
LTGSAWREKLPIKQPAIAAAKRVRRLIEKEGRFIVFTSVLSLFIKGR